MGSVYKIVSLLDERGKEICREDIYSGWDKWQTRNFLNNMNRILEGRKNCSIYLRLNYENKDNKNKDNKNYKANGDIPIFQIPDLFRNLYDVVRMNVSYFHIKLHTKTKITGSKDTDAYLFKFLDVFDALSLSSVNKYFRALGDLYFKNEICNYSKWGDEKYIKYSKEKTEKYPVRNRDWDKEREKERFWISKYMSSCKITYSSNYGRGPTRTISPMRNRETKVLETKVLETRVLETRVLETKVLEIGNTITITYPDGVSKTHSKKREYKKKDIIRFILKNIGEESKINEYLSFGFRELIDF